MLRRARPAIAADVGPGPVFILPVDRQMLDFEGAYIFNLDPDLAGVHRQLTAAPDLGNFPGDGVYERCCPEGGARR